MQSIIEEIFYGNRGRTEDLDYGEEYAKLNDECAEIYGKLSSTFSEEQKKLFDDLTWAESGQQAECERANYVEGFKIGFLIAVECLTK